MMLCIYIIIMMNDARILHNAVKLAVKVIFVMDYIIAYTQ